MTGRLGDWGDKVTGEMRRLGEEETGRRDEGETG